MPNPDFTTADWLRLRGLPAASDPTPPDKPRPVSRSMSGKPTNAAYWAEKHAKRKKKRRKVV